MRGWIIGTLFAVMAVAFWEDEGVRRLHIVLANVWWAASYIAIRLERKQ